ncbi:MAG: hypothetical protein LBU86_06030 [Oscillospiraceae bacterium]|jgi:predicted amidohydrolase|nr:hypothetical protein [Oscillospiraceae bacterium]
MANRSGLGGLIGGGKLNPREVEKIIDRLEIVPSDNMALVSSSAVGVAAVQMQLKPYESIAEYIVDMNLYIADAAARRAHLVVLPAYAGLLPLTAVPQSAAHLKRLAESDAGGLVDMEMLGDSLAHLSDYAFDAYFYTLSTLAARHRIYIMAGSTLYFEENELCHRAFLFSDEGSLAGYQDKISTGNVEEGLQIPPDSEVKVFETPFGGVSVLIGSDADYFECGRIAAKLGAKILLCPTAYVGEYTPIHSSLGPNMRAQENQIYAVASSLVGETTLGFSLEGGGRIFAPNELLKHKNGVAGKTSGYHQPDLACMSLDLDRLLKIKNPYSSDTNTDFLQKNIDRLY